MADLWGAALVVYYGFNSHLHTQGFVVFKVPLNVLFVPAFSLSNVLLQVLLGISVGYHVTCSEGGISSPKQRLHIYVHPRFLVRKYPDRFSG